MGKTILQMFSEELSEERYSDNTQPFQYKQNEETRQGLFDVSADPDLNLR